MLRIVGADARLVPDPFYMAITVAAAALCVWAFFVLRRMKGAPAPRR